MFPDENAVNTSESAPEEQQAVQTQEGAEQTAAAAQPEQEASEQEKVPEQGKAQESVDDFGVPWKNRAMEWQRKFQETTERLPTLIEETLAKHRESKPDREYTIAELEQYAIDNPQYRPWVEEQKSSILQKKVAKIAEEKVKASEQERTNELKRQQAYQYVQSSYPDLFTKDAFGNNTWNTSHPVVQQLGVLMQDPRLSKEPEGIMLAVDAAYGRYSRMQQSKVQSKVKGMQSAVKKLQKNTLIEGGGTNNVQPRKDEFTIAKEQLQKTGSKEAQSAAVKAYLKKIGAIEE